MNMDKFVEASGLFDEKFYLQRYPEVKDLDMSPIVHYIEQGWKEGKDPNVYFSSQEYVEYYADAGEMKVCPLVHFIVNEKNAPKNIYRKEHDYFTYKDMEVYNSDKVYCESLKKIKACVLIHIYYKDGIEDVAKYLKNIPDYVHVYIASDTDAKLNRFKAYLKNSGFELNIEFVKVLNKGRDTGALLVGLNSIIRKYDFFAFLHYKKSPQVNFGVRWRNYLFTNLLGSKHHIEAILHDFIKNENLGIVCPPLFPVFRNASTGDLYFNKNNCDNFLQNKLSNDSKYLYSTKYPSGSMFWARTKAVLDIFDIKLTYKDLDVPSSVIIDGAKYADGTLLHCIERLWCIIAEENKYTCKEAICEDILCLNPVKKKRIAIFACNSINANVLLYKKCLEKIADNVVLVIDSHTLAENDLDALAFDNKVIWKKGNGFNFASWAEALNQLRYNFLEQYDELIFCDDSCIYPLRDLDNVFCEMERDELDFWGINRAVYGKKPIQYIQSSFCVFKKQVFISEAFKKFFSSIPEKGDSKYFAYKFSQLLNNAGFNFTCYFSPIFNFHMAASPLRTFIGGSPLISIESLQTTEKHLHVFYDLVAKVSKHNLSSIPLFQNILTQS